MQRENQDSVLEKQKYASRFHCVGLSIYRHGSGTRPRENRIEPAPTLTDKNRVDRVRGRVRVFPDNPKRGRGRVWDYRYPPRPRPDPDPPQCYNLKNLIFKG